MDQIKKFVLFTNFAVLLNRKLGRFGVQKKFVILTKFRMKFKEFCRPYWWKMDIKGLFNFLEFFFVNFTNVSIFPSNAGKETLKFLKLMKSFHPKNVFPVFKHYKIVTKFITKFFIKLTNLGYFKRHHILSN